MIATARASRKGWVHKNGELPTAQALPSHRAFARPSTRAAVGPPQVAPYSPLYAEGAKTLARARLSRRLYDIGILRPHGYDLYLSLLGWVSPRPPSRLNPPAASNTAGAAPRYRLIAAVRLKSLSWEGILPIRDFAGLLAIPHCEGLVADFTADFRDYFPHDYPLGQYRPLLRDDHNASCVAPPVAVAALDSPAS